MSEGVSVETVEWLGQMPGKMGAIDEEEDEPASKPKGGKRQADPEAEQRAWNAYLSTGSIKAAATACGMDVESVKNWHKRRGWKAKRDVSLAGK